MVTIGVRSSIRGWMFLFVWLVLLEVDGKTWLVLGGVCLCACVRVFLLRGSGGGGGEYNDNVYAVFRIFGDMCR